MSPVSVPMILARLCERGLISSRCRTEEQDEVLGQKDPGSSRLLRYVRSGRLPSDVTGTHAHICRLPMHFNFS